MNYNWKEVEFEIERKSNLIKSLQKDKADLVNSLRLLQSDCVNKDASSVIDGDAFAESRELLHKINIESMIDILD